MLRPGEKILAEYLQNLRCEVLKINAQGSMFRQYLYLLLKDLGKKKGDLES